MTTILGNAPVSLQLLGDADAHRGDAAGAAGSRRAPRARAWAPLPAQPPMSVDGAGYGWTVDSSRLCATQMQGRGCREAVRRWDGQSARAGWVWRMKDPPPPLCVACCMSDFGRFGVIRCIGAARNGNIPHDAMLSEVGRMVQDCFVQP